MIITLELPPDVEAKLRKDAAHHDAEAVRRRLAEAIAPVVDATVDALLQDPSYGAAPCADGLTDLEFEALTDELINMSPALPAPPDTAISRDGIYDHHP
jgi:hypothetical protein